MKLLLFTSFLLISHNTYTQGKFFGGSGDGFATATITNGALPVTIHHFSAALHHNNTAQLSLRLTGTGNLCALLPEKSADGLVFAPFLPPQPVAPAAMPQQYTYTDPAYRSPLQYYRVALVHCNSSKTYSQVLAVKAATTQQVYYASGWLYYNGYAAGETLQVFSSTAQLLFSEKTTGASGTMSLPAMAAGVYFVVAGSGKKTGVLVVQ